MHQRSKCKKDSEHGKQLSAIGFCWSLKKTKWQEMFQQLVSCKEEHGNCLVPRIGSELGRWVTNQRSGHAGMKAARWKQLNKIGFW